MTAIRKNRYENFFRPIIGLVVTLMLTRFCVTNQVFAKVSSFIDEICSQSYIVNVILTLSKPFNQDIISIEKLILFQLPILNSFRTNLSELDVEIDTEGVNDDKKTHFLTSSAFSIFQYEMPDSEVSEHETSPPTEQVIATESSLDSSKKDNPNAKPLQEVTIQSTADGYEQSGLVAVKNETAKYKLDVASLLKNKSFLIKSSNDKPQILIIHTHGTESYMREHSDYYLPEEISRTTNAAESVIQLGKIMTEKLSALGLNVIHDTKLYDYPSYNGSYGRSLASIQDYMKKYPSIQIVIDLHRDAIVNDKGVLFKTVTDTEVGKTSQMMFVAGTDASGLPHENWKKNLSLITKMQQSILEKYPTLMRPINLRKERFNQHATVGSLILEVGTAGNTIEETSKAVQIFCDTAGIFLANELNNK